MATSKQIIEPWPVSKKKWEHLFSLQLPTPNELLELMDSWSNFRQMTIALAETPQKVSDEDKFFPDVQDFVNKACKFFNVSSAKELPLPENLEKKLLEVSTKVTGKSRLTTNIFQSDFPEIMEKALELKQQRKAQETKLQKERRRQEASAQVENDPFFIAAKAIQDKIKGEIKRVEDKNPKDKRLSHLKGVDSSLQQQINEAKEACHNDYLSTEPGRKQEEIKTNCKTEMAKIVKVNLMDNNALDIKFRTWLGRALLNLVMALPIKIHSKRTHIPENQLFFKLKTESQANVEEIQNDIVQLKPTMKD